MKDKATFQEKINAILKNQEFEGLEEFKNPDIWKGLSDEEKETLASLFISAGEYFLSKGDNKIFESFDYASRISPSNPRTFYLQGKVYLSQTQDIRCLTLAGQAFHIAINLRPDYFEAWRAWGNSLMLVGIIQQEAHSFYEANEKFIKAHACANSILDNDLNSFFWEWAQCWHCLGKLSGEAEDLFYALQKYKLVTKNEDPIFWREYGELLTDLSHMTNNHELLHEAIESYQHAINESSEDFTSWYNMGFCFQKLFEITSQTIYYQSANEAFIQASDCFADDVSLWLKWGQLQALYGRIKGDYEILEQSFEKFSKADKCDPNNSYVLSRWAEAQISYGSIQENLDFLKAAELKMIKSLEISPENSEMWGIYGICLLEIGRYFADQSYFMKAIEKFNFGLSHNRNEPLLWYGLALSNFIVGELRNDLTIIQKSVDYFSKALENGAYQFSHFWNDWGVTLMKLAEITNDQTHVEQAIDKFERALGDLEDINDNTNPEWLYNYGCALDFLGDFSEDLTLYEKAIITLQKALQIDPGYANARYNLALALSHLGEAASDAETLYKASEQFQFLLMEDPEDEMAWNDWGLALLNLAQILYDNVLPEKSKELFSQAEMKFIHASSLGCTHSFYNLSCLYSLTENYPLAMHYIERAERANTLPSLDDMLNDDWLEGLRQTDAFRQFISQIPSKYQTLE